ncbi:uncharacterized protein LOC114259750 [Camellia sinensis]|uniref:uncharacterized protein LOC114259750 n=1 Tax=Camellia sinensis TaxID=4442 RepID=UPI001035F2D2|nr:uncharacterized protein LOC114259750 [Camellia sinensis]
MPSIIGETHTAFIGGKNILDGVFIANEVVDGWKKAKLQGLTIKLNFEKAFDSVNWEFMFSMMSSFVAEGLNILLTRALNLGILKGVLVRANEVLISHLQFADDTILLCESDMAQVVIIKRILRCLEVLSELRINYHKSVVCSVGVDDESLHTFANLLTCKIKIIRWMGKMLSLAGRLTLIKSVLSSLPVYYLSLFKMPEGVAREFKKIKAAFLWNGNDLKRKVHLVKWLEVTKSVGQGGLGIRRIRDVNACLLLKWW